MPGSLTTGHDVKPLTIDPDAPYVTFGDGKKDTDGATIVSEGNIEECPPGSKKETKDPLQDLSPAHFDGEWEYGAGGAWLNSKHHSGAVCIADELLLNPEFVITSDKDGDGFVDEEQPKSFGADGCTPITIVDGSGPSSKNPTKHCEYNDPEFPEIDFCGLQRGWWVFVQSGTAGHIWTTGCTSWKHPGECDMMFSGGKENVVAQACGHLHLIGGGDH